MHLPVLKNPEEGTTLDKSTCSGKDNCATCQLYVGNGGRCDGCTPKHNAQLSANFSECYKQCGTCTGYKVLVPAICCRSPMKDMYMTAVTKGAADWNKPHYEYQERPRLNFKSKAVFYVSSGGVNTIVGEGETLVPEGTEVVAVNITRVWGGNGFYSQDLKDYLHLPPKTKLVLMTMCLDDLLERGWNKEFYADPHSFQKVGLDAWMPLSFSSYPEDAHMHQYYQLLRTLYCTEKSHAWWVTGDHRQTGIRTDDLVQEAVAKVPQMIFNMQFSMKDEWFKYHLGILAHYNKILPTNVAFWMVGAATPTFLHNVRKQCGSRPVYFLSAKSLYLASKGQELQMGGGAIKSKLQKKELLYQNMATFDAIVRNYG